MSGPVPAFGAAAAAAVGGKGPTAEILERVPSKTPTKYRFPSGPSARSAIVPAELSNTVSDTTVLYVGSNVTASMSRRL